MKVAFLTHDNLSGGAATAVSRLACGFSEANNEIVDVTLFLAELEQKHPSVNKYLVPSFFRNRHLDKICSLSFRKIWSYFHGTGYSYRNFFAQGSKNIRTRLNHYDIINLFWMQNFLNLDNLIGLEKPIVITLHDMWFLTGGCSYSFDCSQYQDGCTSCQFVAKAFRINLANQFFIKDSILKKESTRVVVTSNWMRNIAINRGIDESKIYMIKNYIPENYYYFDNQYSARKLLGLSLELQSKKILYFVGTIADRRKGFDLFIHALEKLSLELRKNLLILHLGPLDFSFDGYLRALGIDIFHLGKFSDEISQVVAYNSADYLICPSRFDNTPNVIAEAHMCGLPVITSSSSGCQEMVLNSNNGYLVDVTNRYDFASILQIALQSRHIFNNSSIAADASAVYGFEATCKQYQKLYTEIL